MLTLPDSSLHLWHIDLTPPPAEPIGCLSESELERAARMRSPAARAAYTTTRSALRILLGAYLGLPPRSIEFAANAHGKPRLAGSMENQGLVFNVSHTRTAALLGFALDTALGVDIEAPRPHRDLESLAAYCLSSEELVDWRRLAPEQRLTAFTRLWVCKEALTKASGRGLALGLKRIAVDPAFDRYARVPEECGSAADWRLLEWASGDCRAAVAYRGEVRKTELREFAGIGLSLAA